MMFKKPMLLLAVVVGLLFTACSTPAEHEGDSQQTAANATNFDHARLGVWVDGVAEHETRRLFPDAHFVQLNTIPDLVQNLMMGKIDGFVFARPLVLNVQKEGLPIRILPDTLSLIPAAFMLPKTERGKMLCGQLDKFIKGIKADGTLDSLQQKWVEGDESGRTFTKATLTGENGTIVVGTGGDVAPFSYIKNNEPTGYEIEIIDRFCAAYGYKYRLKVMEFGALLANIAVSDVDLGASYLEWTEERAKNMLYTEPTDPGVYVMVVRAETPPDESFLSILINNVKATIIDEDRWKMIAGGVGVTLVITLFAALLGTLFGFAVYMLYRERIGFLNRTIDTSVRLLQGLPVLILLMFFYYVIFGSVLISGTVVAIIAFAILFSVSVFIMLKSGVESISKGQMEAALALGFTERKACIKFILPQVVTIFFPTYQKTLIDMMLSTSIVGYVAVQDLTRVGDLIRARTFDAFVPLIVVSLIYLLLSWLMLKGMDALLSRLNPRNRKAEKILKGIKS